MINSFAYSLDPTGRRTRISENTGRVTTYHYDNLYRLLSESIQDAANGNYQASYQYDRVGNRTQQTINGATTTFAYDNNDRILQMGGTTYSYDTNGNTLNETINGITTHYTFDAKNKLATVQRNGVTTLFNYNADGIRTSQTTGSNTTKYIVDQNQPYAQVLLEIISTPAANDETITYTYGDDLLSQRKNNATSFFHYDGLGSTRALTNDAGTATDKWNYEAFGNTIHREGTTENNYLFTGEQFDKNLNQYYLRARYYNPANGRFTQQDTWEGKICDPITQNKYVYANSDPVMHIDPSGNSALSLQAVNVNLSGIISNISISAVAKTAFVSVATFTIYEQMIQSAEQQWVIVEATARPNILTQNDEVAYEANRREYHNRCDEKPPNGSTQCDKWRWELNRNRDCADMREEFSRRWFGGTDIGHQAVIDTYRKGAKRLERNIKRYCE